MELPKSIDECDYFTKRTIENGYVYIWVLKGEKIMNIKYKCPVCGYEGEIRKEFKRPIRFQCQKCGHKFLIPKLKGKKRKK